MLLTDRYLTVPLLVGCLLLLILPLALVHTLTTPSTMPGDAKDTYAADKVDPALVDGSKDEHNVHVDDHELPPKYNGEAVPHSEYFDHDLPIPTEEDLATLRRVSEKIPFKAYTIAFVELVERLSFYGTTQVGLTRPYDKQHIAVLPAAPR